MRIGFIGDPHFGAGFSLGGRDPETQHNTRLIDFSNTFNNIVDGFVAKNVTHIVIPGDIFETRQPSSAQISSFSKCIRRAVDKGFKILMIVGNHDQQRHISTTTLDYMSDLKIPELTICQQPALCSLDKNTHIIALPYRDRRMLGANSNAEAVENMKKRFDKFVEEAKGTKIAVGHFMVEGTNNIDPELFSVNELILPKEMFKKCDFAIMGHVHKHEFLTEEKPVIVYSGSMEKTSFGEREHTKVSLIIDTATGKIEAPKTKVRNLYEMEFAYFEDEKIYGQKINDVIIADINKYDKKHSLKDGIVRVVVKVKENDTYYVNQNLLRDHVIAKKANYCAGINVISMNNRQLRNSKINETITPKKAISSFIDGLIDHEKFKKQLLKTAEGIIDEVEGK